MVPLGAATVAGSERVPARTLATVVVVGSGVVDVVAASVVAVGAAVVTAGAWVDEGEVTVVESLQPATTRPSVATRPRNRR